MKGRGDLSLRAFTRMEGWSHPTVAGPSNGSALGALRAHDKLWVLVRRYCVEGLDPTFPWERKKLLVERDLRQLFLEQADAGLVSADGVSVLAEYVYRDSSRCSYGRIIDGLRIRIAARILTPGTTTPIGMCLEIE